ncbi:hypothetical protein VP01_5606g1 [Puccinia sorghi]|uniref:Uncharacterized protein n=1 Tax=Puccinia sorghi TaxID=27349 RepID=A0A0L6UIZ9_9BASI|nr:hypothetical protein VP01_5606g1 [Puccinia sorghi]
MTSTTRTILTTSNTATPVASLLPVQPKQPHEPTTHPRFTRPSPSCYQQNGTKPAALTRTTPWPKASTTAPGDSLAVRMAIAKVNRVPRKRRHTAEQVRDAVSSTAAKKVQKAAYNAEAACKKSTAKAAKEMVKAMSATQFMWTEATFLELLAFIKMLKDESRQPGFTNFTKFLLQNNNRKEVFPLLAKLERNTLM